MPKPTYCVRCKFVEGGWYQLKLKGLVLWTRFLGFDFNGDCVFVCKGENFILTQKEALKRLR